MPDNTLNETVSAAEAMGVNIKPLKTKVDDKSAQPEVEAFSKNPPEPVSPVADVFNQPNFKVSIIAALGLADPLDLANFRHQLKDTLLQHNRFHSIIEKKRWGGMQWRPVDVVLDDHIIVTQLPEGPGTDNPVLTYISTLSGTPLNPTRPLWEMHVLQHSPMGATVCTLVLRVSHSLGDGISLMSLLLACSRSRSNPDHFPVFPQPSVAQSPTFLSKLWRPFRVFGNTLNEANKFNLMVACVRDTKTAVKGTKDGYTEPRTAGVSSPMDITGINLIKSAVGPTTTVNDVLLGVLAGGLRRYLLSVQGGPGSEQGPPTASGTPSTSGLKPLPRRPLVRALMLANLRKAPGLQELDQMMQGKSKAPWGNKLGYMMLALPLEELPSELERVRRAKTAMDRKKASWEAPLSYYNGMALYNTAGVKTATTLTRRAVDQTTCSYSNIVGPGEEVVLFGARVTSIQPFVFGTGHTLVSLFTSYNGHVQLMVQAPRSRVPDIQAFTRCVDEEFAALRAAAEGELAGGAGADGKMKAE